MCAPHYIGACDQVQPPLILICFNTTTNMQDIGYTISTCNSLGAKRVIGQGCSQALLLFPTCITITINFKYYSKPYCYKLIQYVLPKYVNTNEELLPSMYVQYTMHLCAQHIHTVCE